MKKRILSALLLASMLLSCLLFGCKAPQDSPTQDSPLVYYCLGEADEMYELISKYNKHVAIYGDWNDRIETVNFSSSEELRNTISTEIMAGKGPDFFSLSQSLPFEKMIENGSLADINELVSKSEYNINFEDFNKTVMDAGVFDGKRYLLPLFYCPDVLFSTDNRVEALGVDPATVTFSQLAQLKASGEKDFVYGDSYYKLECLNSIILQFTDFKEKKSYYNTPEFSQAVKDFEILFEGAEGGEFDYDFLDTKVLTRSPVAYMGFSIEAAARNYCLQQEKGRELVLLPAYNRNGTISAFVERGIAINANSKNTEKLMMFIDFLLSDDTQAYHCGALRKTRMFSGGLVSFPVKNKILEDAFQVELEDVYDSDYDTVITGEEELINNKKIAFLNETLRPLADSITECRIYGKSLNLSHFEQNVVGDIVNRYNEGELSIEQFSKELQSAADIYLTE